VLPTVGAGIHHAASAGKLCSLSAVMKETQISRPVAQSELLTKRHTGKIVLLLEA
jgi:hypothetical protein